MYDHTTLKAFVAETAAKISAEMCKEFTMHKDISLLMDDDIQSKITKVSVTMAHKLSIQLGRWWNDEFDDGTVMFDPDDSPTSEIERRLKFIGGILMDFRYRMGNLLSLYFRYISKGLFKEPLSRSWVGRQRYSR